MPKNDKSSNAKNVTPEAVTVESSEAPLATRPVRRLGTGAIVGISAAGFAVIAGVFGGGIALGVGISHNAHGGMMRNVAEASGQREGGRMHDGPMMSNLPPLPAMPGAPSAPIAVPAPNN